MLLVLRLCSPKLAEVATSGRLVMVESVQPSNGLVIWAARVTFTQLPVNLHQHERSFLVHIQVVPNSCRVFVNPVRFGS